MCKTLGLDHSEDVFLLDHYPLCWFVVASFSDCLDRVSNVVGDIVLGEEVAQCRQLHSGLHPP